MRWLLLALLLVACKGKEPKVDIKKSIVVVDVTACRNALDEAAHAPLDARPKILLAGCRVCGPDWTPLLTWNLEPPQGPKRELVQEMLENCQAFCTGDSKLKFMSGLDKARGQNVDTPWRMLAKTCKEKVNASADERFMSAPFFALDRIARTLASKTLVKVDTLSAVELPLPAVTISGAGVTLPDADGVMSSVGPLHITVLGDAIYIGRLPRGKLTPGGVTADLGPTGYPGEQVKIEELGAKLTALVGDQDKTQPITLLAPSAMPAQKLVPIIAAASAVSLVQLGANASESPTGWQLPGAIPIDLEAGTDISVSGEMKVQDLAKELATRAARKENRVGLKTN